MSDALTDISRDEKRSAYFENYLITLSNYLAKPSKKIYEKLKNAGESIDVVPRGYFGGRTNFSQNFNDFMNGLCNKDVKTWCELLNMSKDSIVYEKLHKLSPLSDKILIHVDYGNGFCDIDLGDFEKMIHDKIRGADFRTFDCDNYNLVLPKDKLEKVIEEAKIVWLRCGISDVKGARNANGNLKRNN